MNIENKKIMYNTSVTISAVILFSVVSLFGIHWLSEWRRKKKQKVLFESVSIGDKYIRNRHEANPFRAQWGETVTIIDKRMSKDGIVYVKYKGTNECFSHDEALSYMIEVLHYEPYTGQDKQSL